MSAFIFVLVDGVCKGNGQAFGDEPFHTIVTKADLDYLVKAMTEWALKWETNGCKTAKRRLVENAKLFQELPTLVGDLKASNFDVLFWRVPRRMNQEADKLGNQARADQNGMDYVEINRI
ncbi:hypothetical protein HZ326_25387 [Fusarium oxysporum f. sp. albedinis]|nr:hypothetical protein HZ326_25387 [Fusarium oxysporum f. sp. albedinis]